MENTARLLAVDVAQDELAVYDGSRVCRLPNRKKEVLKLLEEHAGFALVCEPTSTFHLELAGIAFSQGRRVFLVNPKEIQNYRECRSFRAKTDEIDAVAIFEFARRHEDALRAWNPPPQELEELKSLLARRKALVEARTSLGQAFGKAPWSKVELPLSLFIEEIDERIEELARGFEDYERMLSLPGVGPSAAAALTYALARHPFASADALVAFLGLDLRVRDSGRFKGQRKLSKRGDPVLRYFVGMAGFGLLQCKLARPKKAALQAKQRKFHEQTVIAARKIVRAAYALHRNGSTFDPQKWRWNP